MKNKILLSQDWKLLPFFSIKIILNHYIVFAPFSSDFVFLGFLFPIKVLLILVCIGLIVLPISKLEILSNLNVRKFEKDFIYFHNNKSF